ncbi:MAG: ACT domain-containing protein [Elusimicrobiota bacterium]
MNVRLIRQYSVFMPNRPGALAHLATLFGEAGVNIVGITSEVRDDSALVRVAIESDRDHSHILSRAGFASVEGRLLSVVVDDKPGQLARVTKALADGGLNITTVYGASLDNEALRLLVTVENADEGLKLLQGVD